MNYLPSSEKHFNGSVIDWNYWVSLNNITPIQAAKLSYRIDPIIWSDNNFALGKIPADIQNEIKRLEQKLRNFKPTWSLQELTSFLRSNSPEGMLEIVNAQNAVVITSVSPHTLTQTRPKEREVTAWLRETWIIEHMPGGTDFFRLLKKYENVNGSPIINHYSAGKNAGFSWRTSTGRTGTMSKKTVLTKVSKFKNNP
jgi:hypothetical protein